MGTEVILHQRSTDQQEKTPHHKTIVALLLRKVPENISFKNKNMNPPLSRWRTSACRPSWRSFLPSSDLMIQMSVGPEKQGKKIINISYDDFFAAFSTAGDSNKIMKGTKIVMRNATDLKKCTKSVYLLRRRGLSSDQLQGHKTCSRTPADASCRRPMWKTLKCFYWYEKYARL